MAYLTERKLITPSPIGTFHAEHHGAGAWALMITGKRCRKAKFVRWFPKRGEETPTQEEMNAMIGYEVKDKTAPADAPRYGMPGDGPVPIHLVGKLKP